MIYYMNTLDEKYMKMALKCAKKAYDIDETPIGCVIVYEGRVIARGYNRRNTDRSTLAHAEIQAIKKASKVLGDWRLSGCTMYVTLEPCQMCAGALVQARIDRVVIGSMNKKAGCVGSIINILQMSEFNHQAEVTRGVLEEECSELMSSFFKKLREKKKETDMIKKTLATMTLTKDGRGDNKPYGIINECKERGNECKAYFFPKDNKPYRAGELLHVKVIGVATTETEKIMIAVKSDRMVESLSELTTNERIRLNQMFAKNNIQEYVNNEEPNQQIKIKEDRTTAVYDDMFYDKEDEAIIVYGDVFHDMEYARRLMWEK